MDFMKSITIYERFTKRFLDFTLSLIALIILFPLLIIVGLIVRLKLGSPIFFKQARPGKNEKTFYILKFRTMTNKTNKLGELLDDKSRLTSFGRFLRASSIDELPSLLNILKGDMSIIGPRPLLIEYLPLYSVEQRRRHEVRPGLSGLAQVSGRNTLVWEEKFMFDIQYIDNIRFFGDIKLIIKTLYKAIKRTGISSNTSVTMEKFNGNNTIKK